MSLEWMLNFNCVPGHEYCFIGEVIMEWNGNISVFVSSVFLGTARVRLHYNQNSTFNQLFHSRPLGRHLNLRVCEKNRNRELKFHASNVFKYQMADIWFYWSPKEIEEEYFKFNSFDLNVGAMLNHWRHDMTILRSFVSWFMILLYWSPSTCFWY